MEKNLLLSRFLEVIEDVTTLLNREQYWLDEYNCVKTGYNICPVAGSCLGIKRSAEVKKRMSQSKLGHTLSQESRDKISEAKKGNSFKKGKRHTQESKEKSSKAHLGKPAWNRGLKITSFKGYTWKITSPDCKVFTVENLAEFCRANELNKGCMVMVSKGQRKHHKRWGCKKYE